MVSVDLQGPMESEKVKSRTILAVGLELEPATLRFVARGLPADPSGLHESCPFKMTCINTCISDTNVYISISSSKMK